MAMAKKVKYRVKGDPAFSGVRWGVAFAGGVGATEDERTAQRLAELGYQVEALTADAPEEGRTKKKKADAG